MVATKPTLITYSVRRDLLSQPVGLWTGKTHTTSNGGIRFIQDLDAEPEPVQQILKEAMSSMVEDDLQLRKQVWTDTQPESTQYYITG